jgi:hypothetical protein
MPSPTAPSRCATPHHYYYCRQGSDLRFGPPFRSASTAACRRLAARGHGGGNELMNEFYKKYKVIGFPAATPAVRWAAGSARRSRPSRPQGPEDAHRRFRGSGARQARRRAAADRGGDIYPGAREGHDRRRRVGRPLRRREARLPEGREVLLLSRLVGRRPDAAQLHQPREVERAAEALQGDHQDRVGAYMANECTCRRVRCGNPARCAVWSPAVRKLASVLAPIMDACYKAANEVYAETSAKNADFKKIHDPTWRSATSSICGGRSPNTASTASRSASARRGS